MSSTVHHLRVEDLTKIYPHPLNPKVSTPVLVGASFTIDSTKVNYLVGPSGSGKSTLLAILRGSLPYDAGEIIFDNVSLTSLEPKKLRLIMSKVKSVSQIPRLNLDFDLLLEENFLVQLILSQNKISVLERKKVIDDLLEDLNLTHLKQSHLDKFSGGELQRAAIGMAIISRPLILLLDEATAMLDSASVANINEIIGKLNKKYNTLIIFATHDESLISHENVIKLYNGRISSSAK